MMEHIRAEPVWLQAWIFWMGIVNLTAIAFIKRIEARWTVASFLGAAVVMSVLFEVVGYVRLLGLAHVLFWTPLVIYLYRRRGAVGEAGGAFRVWAISLFLTISVSLVIDYVDVIRYLAGDRS